MIQIRIRNPLNYELLFEGEFRSLKKIVNDLNKKYPHQTMFSYNCLKNQIYQKNTMDWIELKRYSIKDKMPE